MWDQTGIVNYYLHVYVHLEITNDVNLDSVAIHSEESSKVAVLSL